MSSSVPTPLAAALGLVPTVVGSVRRLPGKAVQVPVLALSAALTALENARQEYDDLAERGERLLAGLGGTRGAVDRAEAVVEDAASEVTETVSGTAKRLAGQARDVVEDAASDVSQVADRAVDAAGGAAEDVTPEAELPKGTPTPKAPELDLTRVDTAASADVVETVEQVVAQTSTPAVGHAALPLADYDHLTLGSLRGRLRSLSVPELVQLRDYEKAHADRLPVVTMLDNRIAKLATDASATPSAGGGAAPLPAPDAASEGKVSGPSGAHTGTPPRTKVRTT